MSDTTIAYSFVGDTLRDGRHVPKDGVKLVYEGPIKIVPSYRVPLKVGLHASLSAFDALFYAPGNTLCKVQCSDIVERERDRFICREKTILQRFDLYSLSYYFTKELLLVLAPLWCTPNSVLKYFEKDNPKLRPTVWDETRDSAIKTKHCIEMAKCSANAERYSDRYSVWGLLWGEQRIKFDSLVEQKFKELTND